MLFKEINRMCQYNVPNGIMMQQNTESNIPNSILLNRMHETNVTHAVMILRMLNRIFPAFWCSKKSELNIHIKQCLIRILKWNVLSCPKYWIKLSKHVHRSWIHTFQAVRGSKKIWIWCSNTMFQIELCNKNTKSNILNLILLNRMLEPNVTTLLWYPKCWIEHCQHFEMFKWNENTDFLNIIMMFNKAELDIPNGIPVQNSESNVPNTLWWCSEILDQMFQLHF